MSGERVDALLYRCDDCSFSPCSVESSTRPMVEQACEQFDNSKVSRVEVAAACGGLACGVNIGFGFFINHSDEVIGVFSLVEDELKTIKEFSPYATADEIQFNFVDWAQRNSLQKHYSSL